MSDDLKGIWEHYKGKRYEVIAVAHHSETEEAMVIYKALYPTKYGDDSLWVRPLTMFLSQVMVDGHEQARFKKIN